MINCLVGQIRYGVSMVYPEMIDDLGGKPGELFMFNINELFEGNLLYYWVE